MTSDTCVVLIPVLNRPHRVVPLLESLIESRAEARPLFICSPDDTAEQDAIRATGADMLILDREPTTGDYARKIQYGYQSSTEPLLFLAADDLFFHPRWLQNCQRRFEKPDVQVVGTNDLTNKRTMQHDHSTHTLLTRVYVDEYGTIDQRGQVLHEGYPHEYVDDELIETAKSRGVYAHARDAFVEHLHPMAGKAPMDFLYEQQGARMRSGRRLFIRRRRLWS